MVKTSTLAEIICSRIRCNGPISFHDFMEMALYYPELGYYTSINEKIGKNGDYFTSPELTDVFSKMVGRQLEEMWLLLERRDFTIVEYGAGTGSLCCGILSQLKKNTPFYECLSYRIIEKSGAMRQKEKELFKESDLDTEKIGWNNSIQEIGPIDGCIIANEVLDNFSVHKVVMTSRGLMEVFVDYNKGDFVEIFKAADPKLANYFSNLEVDLPEGFHAEVNLEAINWLKQISGSLRKGFVLIVDYGYPSSEMYELNHQLGTMVCYANHSINDRPFMNIGKQDITAHVNFSALNYWGSKFGLSNCGFTNQALFLKGLGINDEIRNTELSKGNLNRIKAKLEAISILLISMGRKLKVLIQQKGLQNPVLSGLHFQQPLH